MPYAIEHNAGTKTYSVINIATGQVHAHNATLPHAEAQVRLLHSLEDKHFNDMEKYNRGRMTEKGHKKREKKLSKLDPEERQEEIEHMFKKHH